MGLLLTEKAGMKYDFNSEIQGVWEECSNMVGFVETRGNRAIHNNIIFSCERLMDKMPES